MANFTEVDYDPFAPNVKAKKSDSESWNAINSASIAEQPNRDGERLRILQDEYAQETNPINQAALQREIKRAGGVVANTNLTEIDYNPFDTADLKKSAAPKEKAAPQKQIAKNDPTLAEGPAQLKRIKELYSDAVKNSSGDSQMVVPDMALSAATGIGSSILGGLAGLTRTGYNLLSGEGFDKSMKRGANTLADIQQGMTYQPRTSAGKLGNELISVPFNALKQGISSVAGDIGQYVGGDKGENIGNSLGNVAPDIYMTLRGGANALKAAPKPIEKPPIPGKDFSPLRELSPEEAARMQQMTDLNVKPTLGQVTRDPAQWRFEEQTGKQTNSKPGEQLRQRELDTNDAIIKAIEDTDTMRKGTALSQNTREMGSSVGNALKAQADASKEKTNLLYQKAKDSGETKQIVKTKPLEDYLNDSFYEDPSLAVIQRKLEGLKAQNKGKLSIDDLENLYKTASKQSKPGDPSSVYMGEVKRKINELTDGIGGDLYRDARKSRLEHGLEYEDRAAISRLIENKTGSRTDVKTASEDVFNKTVVNGSLEELKDVTNSLLNNGSKQSLQAVREIQHEVIDHILKKATEKGVLNERDAKGVSPTALRNAIDDIGTDKLNHLLGPDAMKRLDDIVKTGQYTKQKSGAVQGSDTNLNVSDAAQQALKDASRSYLLRKIPGGKLVGDFLDSKKQQKIIQDRTTESLYPRKAAPAETERQANDVRRGIKNAEYGRANESIYNMLAPAYVADQSPKNKLRR